MLALTAPGPLEYVVMVAVLMVIVTLITCICWRGKRPSAENLGLPGRIKVTNQDDAGVTLNGTSSYAVGREDTRLSALHRELPQIPTALGDANPRRSSSAPSEHTSELYAVVADPAAAPATAAGSQGVTAAGAGAGSAQGGRPAERTEQEEQPESDSYYEQPALTRSRAERQSSQPPTSSHSRNPSTASREIPARLAVSGVVPASHELPYMTPPVHRPPAEAAPPAQLHFSGDSVQSADSRGYTRITVREPAAELTLTERPAGGPAAAAAGAAPSADNFYATVDGSDDEMYEAIPERRRRVEQPPPPPPPLSAGEDQPDGSDGPPEPPVTPVGSIGGSGGGGRAGSVEPAVTTSGGQRTNVPPPPSVDSLRQALVHSRQASCSSVASSGGSPPPDRRLARSPLPPLPDLDQLYAKVQKTPRPPAAGSPPPPPPPPEPVYQAADPPPPVNYSDFELVRDPIRRPRPVVRRESSLDPNYESIETRSRRAAADDVDDDADDAGYDRVRRVDSAVGAGGGSDDGAGYARVLRPAATADGTVDPAPPRRREHHYERVRRRRDEDPLYEKISSSPAASEVYDEIRWARGPRPQPPSDAESFYESVRFGSELDADPNYEMLPAKPGSDPEELYSCIWDRRGAEDPYASIKRSDSPPYESIARPPPIDSDSDSDTIGYESVRAAPSAASGSNQEDRATPLAVDPAAPATDGGGDPAVTAAATAADLSQLYAKVQKVQRQATGQQAEVAPPVPDALWTLAPSEPDDSGAVVRMDSSSASTSQYTSASEAGTPLLPKRLDDLDSPRRRRSTTSVDSGSVTQSERDELMPPP